MIRFTLHLGKNSGYSTGCDNTALFFARHFVRRAYTYTWRVETQRMRKRHTGDYRLSVHKPMRTIHHQEILE